MLSRVANSVYWMCRYIERAENVARFINANLNLSLDLMPGSDEQWEPLVRTTVDLPLFQARHDEANRANVIDFLAFDRANPNSIISCLNAARENARGVRDAISSEMWEQVNTFYLFVAGASYADLVKEDSYTFFNRVKMQSHLFNGVSQATMSHGEAWHFGELGRQIERADKTCRLLDVKYFILLPSVNEVGSPLDTLQWRALLKSASAFEMFKKRHGSISPRKVAEFLILDREFPRAISHCLGSAQESLHAITGSAVGTFTSPPEQLLGVLCSQLNFGRIDEIIAFGLHEFLDNTLAQLNLVGDAIHESLFAVRPVKDLDTHRRSSMNSGTNPGAMSQVSGGAE
ncbi:MAG: alpha-E domain-containing protein [Actinomycetota bacterium]